MRVTSAGVALVVGVVIRLTTTPVGSIRK